MKETSALAVVETVVMLLREETSNKDLTCHAAAAWLFVARHGETTMGSLQEHLGVGQSTVSRIVQSLALGRPDSPGADLMKAVVDPYNQRQKILTISPKGKALLRKIALVAEAWK